MIMIRELRTNGKLKARNEEVRFELNQKQKVTKLYLID